MPNEAWRSEEWLEEMYWEEDKSLREISNMVDYSAQTVANVMDRLGVPRRSREEATRKKLSVDHVTYYTSKQGYEVWKGPKPRNKSISVHRLLAVSEFGVDAVAGNHVHHDNGIPWDNRPENLKIVSNSEHGKIHYPERAKSANGSKNFI